MRFVQSILCLWREILVPFTPVKPSVMLNLRKTCALTIFVLNGSPCILFRFFSFDLFVFVMLIELSSTRF